MAAEPPETGEVAHARRRVPLVALFFADAISLSGNAVAQLAIPWYVLRRPAARR